MLDEYFTLREKVFEYFGYVEGYKVLPLMDYRDVYWKCDGYTVKFSAYYDAVAKEEDQNNLYEVEIYTSRYLKQYIYEKEDYTLICVDTNCDGNQFLMVLDNSLKV